MIKSNPLRYRSLACVDYAALGVIRAQPGETMYTADPAPMVHKGTLYLFSGHDEEAGKIGNFNMKNWCSPKAATLGSLFQTR